MGGYGSTRWAWHRRKIQVEESLKLRIKTITPSLTPGYTGWVGWTIRGEMTDQITYRVLGIGQGKPSAVRLAYTQTDRSGAKEHFDYSVELTTTVTSWGSLRYWFICPLIINGRACRRRVGVLYLPPGGRYFGCRHCHNLAYRSSQEQHESDGLYRLLAGQMVADHPGMTPADIRYVLEGGRRPAGGYYAQFERRRADLIAELLAQAERRYEGYLSAGDLCKQSGLSAGDLERLGAARLLLPDREGLYRPKLLSWARKLAYLLAAGWEVSEVKAWARGRWHTDNPRAWPPDRAAWQPKGDTP